MNETDTTTDTMANVSHTNPYTGETAGRLFNRGPIVAADGGEAEANGNGRTDKKQKMRDVDHTPPKEADDANRVFERGTEHGGRADRETVVEEEEEE
ncbi:hypothetical protein BDK88_2434 [Natrinema hispanicum]|uniref:Uncharacterized protein n=1 Tax=Natrinema hispanicum TaxID=392421 RepID=A0A482YEM0_9EURY|nr:hypothetical protein [Natrinema hispanicum]RZV11191.1 hypothetical protein BDK88_2434 [Natrinema hispanicum]